MRFLETRLAGVYLLELEQLGDDRGFFARAWCRREFEAHGLNPDAAQANVGFSRSRGTLRGLHFQAEPHEECKLVRCTRGAVADVVVDLRTGSATHREWISIELTAENRRVVYVPAGCAHGYQTLMDDTEIVYQASQFFSPAHARKLRLAWS